jgi:phosphoglycolate phosphatase
MQLFQDAPHMKPISLLIFDLDGTLANTLEDIAASLNHALGRLGRSPLPMETVGRYIGDGLEMLLTRALGGQSGPIEDAAAIYIEHHRRNLVVSTSLYPAVKETLEYFKSLPMAVITNKPGEFSEVLLDRLGIHKYFTLVIGADNGLPLKPAPDPILKILTDLGVAKERAVIVGDGATDVIAGKAAGIMTCSVTYGFRSEKELKKTGPDYVIHTLSELKALFKPEK